MPSEELLEHSYSYLRPSSTTCRDGVVDVSLATSGGHVLHPRFFSGAVLHTRQTARMLQAVARIARTRFFTHPAATPYHRGAREGGGDPVVTASEEMLRFESLSPCAGVYVRFDLEPECLRGEFAGHGTTNVDFNADMRAALGAATDDDSLRLSVGAESLELESGSTKVIERRVPLPERWLKSFSEVQLAQQELDLRHELEPTPARRFLRELPATRMHGAGFWVVPAGAGVRLSRQGGRGGVALGGVDRLRVLADLARDARAVRIYGGPRGVCAWELVLERASFQLVLSAEASRGFSGEGNVLSALTDPDAGRAAERIRDELRWQRALEVEALSDATSLDPSRVRRGLAVLSAAGLVGYDLRLGCYFHRELPFERESLEALQPRLRDARRLLKASAVRLVGDGEHSTEALVSSGGVDHRVRIEGDEARCTCPWFGRHRGERGPCKHVLAVRLAVAERPAAVSPR